MQKEFSMWLHFKCVDVDTKNRAVDSNKITLNIIN